MSDREASKAEIESIIREIYSAFKEGNRKKIDNFIHPDITVWEASTSELICGLTQLEQIRTSERERMDSRGPLTLDLEDPLIDTWGDAAIARYYLKYSFAPPNSASGHVRITDIYRRYDGKWLAVHHHEGLVPTKSS